MTSPRDVRIPGQRRYFGEIADDRLLREILHHVFSETADPMFLFTSEGEIAECNQAVLDELGYSEEEFIALDIFSSIFAVPPPAKMEQFCKTLEPSQSSVLDGTLRRKDGTTIAFRMTVTMLKKGRPPLLLCTARTAKEHSSSRERPYKTPLRDPVTGLSSRSFLDEELERLDNERFLPLSVIRGDLNGIKLVNSAFGHTVGDKLLKTAARVLRKHCRSSDLLVRWESDEFLLLLPRTREDDATTIVERIEDAFRSSKVKEFPVPPSISMGCAAKVHRWQDFKNVLRDAEEDMREKQLAESRKIHTKLLSSLLKSLDENTPESEEHIVSMRKIARILGEFLELSPKEIEHLDLAVRLHDVGKSALPPYLLNKIAPLSEEERESLRKHAEIGGQIAEAGTPETSAVSAIIRSHHERWDGSGYPDGLAGESIPLLSRIIAVVDSFDVMTRGTPYKDPLPEEKALSELERLSGLQFDPALVSLFVKNVEIIRGKDEESSLLELEK